MEQTGSIFEDSLLCKRNEGAHVLSGFCWNGIDEKNAEYIQMGMSISGERVGQHRHG